MESPGAPIEGTLELTVVGSYCDVSTFAAEFHAAGTDRKAPSRMIGLEVNLREFLDGGGISPERLNAAVAELKAKGRVRLAPVSLGRAMLQHYLLDLVGV